MLHMLRDLDTFSYQHRSYVVNSGDTLSAGKAIEFELYLERKAKRARRAARMHEDYTPIATMLDVMERETFYGTYDLAFVPRARHIHQSLLKTPWSAFLCLLSCLSVLRGRHLSVPWFIDANPESFADFPSALNSDLRYPDLIIANGPATATILIFTSYILRCLSLPGTSGKMRSIYVESWARVRQLSLSGKLLSLFGMCERMLVQWEELAAEARGGNWGRQEFIGALVG